MSSILDRPNPSIKEPTNCSDKNCPRHGSVNATLSGMVKSAQQFAAANGVATGASHTDCKNPACPQHGRYSGSSSGGSLTKDKSIRISGTIGIGFGDGKPTKKPEPVKEKDIDDLVQKTQQMLRVTAPASKSGGTNNVVTFITNHSGSTETLSVSRSASPSVSPMKDRLSGSGMYDQMRMEHSMKENAVLQAITVKQNEEILALQEKLKEMKGKLVQSEKENNRLNGKIKNFAKITQDWNKVLKEYQDTIKTLKSKVNYSDLKAKQLKRMASESASCASKWRVKAMDALTAQKELEEKKTASDRAAIGLYHQFREEKKKIVELKRKHGATITESDLDDTMSTVLGTLDTTMLEQTLSVMSSPSNTINQSK